MEIREALSFYHSRVKYLTLQELLANNTRSLIRDSKKIRGVGRLEISLRPLVKFKM